MFTIGGCGERERERERAIDVVTPEDVTLAEIYFNPDSGQTLVIILTYLLGYCRNNFGMMDFCLLHFLQGSDLRSSDQVSMRLT